VNFTFSQAWVMAVLLTSIRVGTVLMLAPTFSMLQGFTVVRLLFSVALGALLTPVAEGTLPTLSTGALVLAAVAEAAVGFALAYGIVMAFAAFSVAGKILDIQTGLGLGNVYDPVTRKSAPIMGTLLNMVGLAVFYALDGHRLAFRGLAYSLERIPLGHGLQAVAMQHVVALFGLAFSLGVALIAPILLALLVIEAGLAVLAKMLPQMNVFAVSTPAKSLAGLVILALATPMLGDPMARIYRSIFDYWEGVLG
jgi:flagellar biosynthetic protein FliR